MEAEPGIISISAPRSTRRKASGGVISFLGALLPAEPPTKRTVAFIDAQNLFHAAKEAFGYRHPNFDPLKLAQTICKGLMWSVESTRLYTGVPAPNDDAFWNLSGRPSARRWAARG